MVEAERLRDDELDRLRTRHLRDKQKISALSNKVERLELELRRAADIEEHEAEPFLDLLRNNSFSHDGRDELRSTHRHGDGPLPVHSSAEVDQASLEYEGSSDAGTERDEKAYKRVRDKEDEESMRGLLKKQEAATQAVENQAATAAAAAGVSQDVLNAKWTEQLAQEQDKRRKLFAQKQKRE